MFPMKALHAVLKARFSDRPAGHWVVFKGEIAGVELFVMAYAWSQRGVSYFVSTCGKTEPHPEKYQSHFEDDFGNIVFKEINRPHIAHFLYEFLPLIDEHNKQQQSLLNLEHCWLTKDCWFRLITTLTGMSVVDMHRWDRNKRYGQRRQQELDDNDDYIKITKFSDLICGWLDTLEPRKRASPRRRMAGQSIDESLERIRGADGSLTYPPTQKQLLKGRSIGTARQQSCFICRKYKADYQQTSWKCIDCGMPLCKQSRADEPGREMSCLAEHQASTCPALGCNLGARKSFLFPDDLKLYPS
jgi:hypothetical protein